MLPIRGDSCRPSWWATAARRSWLLLLALGLTAGCASSLNPSFLTSLGISPINSLSAQPGSIVLVLINRTAFLAEMRVRLFEEEGYQSVSRLTAGANEFFATAHDCEISQMTIEGVAVWVTTDAGGTQEEAVVGFTAALTSGLNYTCGRVIVGTVSGTAQNFEFDLRVE